MYKGIMPDMIEPNTGTITTEVVRKRRSLGISKPRITENRRSTSSYELTIHAKRTHTWKAAQSAHPLYDYVPGPEETRAGTTFRQIMFPGPSILTKIVWREDQPDKMTEMRRWTSKEEGRYRTVEAAEEYKMMRWIREEKPASTYTSMVLDSEVVKPACYIFPASPLSPWSSSPPQIPFPLSPPPPVLTAPPSSPIRSLGYRAATIRMRAEATATSHSLPLPPPFILSPTRPDAPPPLPTSVPTSLPPLLLPSASRKEDKPKVNLPPRKRLGIALGPIYEVGESSAVAAARPLGDLRADYSFTATMDREIRFDPERYVGYGITDSWDEIVETLQGDPVSTDTELGAHMREFESMVRDRRAHAHTRYLMETDARFSHEAWGRSMDASDLAHGEVMSLRTIVHAQMSEIRELQSADHSRQREISNLLETDHGRRKEMRELRVVDHARQQQIIQTLTVMQTLQREMIPLHGLVTTLQGQDLRRVAVEFVVETSLDCFGYLDHRLRSRSQLSSLLRRLWIVSVILIFGLDQGIDAIDGLDGTERGYQRLCLGEMFCLFKQKVALEKKSIMGEPLSPDRVFDFPMDEPEPHPAYDFFAPGPLPGYAGNPNNNNRWIEADVTLLRELGAEADELMVGPLVGEITEPIVEMEEQVIALVIDMEEDIAMLFGDGDFSDDNSEGFEDEEEVWDVNEEWLMAPVTPPLMPVVPPPSTYEVGGPSTTAAEGQSFTLPAPGFPVPPSVIKDLSTRISNLEYGHRHLVKKVIQVSDVEVADGITIGEISPRVSAIEGQVQVMASQMGQVVGRLEQVGTQVEQDSQIQQLQTMTSEMSSCESTLMQCILRMDKGLADLERRPPGPQ
ncbi:hypothetical protein Tco_0191552 [Tanacetum coccineum]